MKFRTAPVAPRGQWVCSTCGHLHYRQVSNGACTSCDCARRNGR